MMASILDRTRASIEVAIDKTRDEDDLVPVSFNRKQLHALLMGVSFLDIVSGSMALFVSEVVDRDDDPEEDTSGRLQS